MNKSKMRLRGRKGGPIRIGVIVGSINDLPQCSGGYQDLIEAEARGEIILVVTLVNSIHRNTLETLSKLRDYTVIHCVERWIIGAGMANHLTATCDAFLRYEMKSIAPVFGCVFLTEKDTELNLETSIRSITQAPGKQVVFDSQHPFFADACKKAIEIEDVKIELRMPVETRVFLTAEAVLAEIELLKEKKR